MKTGWDFFDARGNQGHMYAGARFTGKSFLRAGFGALLSVRRKWSVIHYRGRPSFLR